MVLHSSSYSWYHPRRRRLVNEHLNTIFKMAGVENTNDAATWIVKTGGGDKKYGKEFRPFGTHNYMYGFNKAQLVKVLLSQADKMSLAEVMLNEDARIFKLIGSPKKPTPIQIVQFCNIWAQDLEKIMEPINTVAPWVTLSASLISFLNFGGFMTFMALLLGVVSTEMYSYTQDYANTGMSIEQYLFFGMFLFSKPKWKTISFLTAARLYALFEIGTSLISDPPQLARYGNGNRVGHVAHAASITLGALLIRYL